MGDTLMSSEHGLLSGSPLLLGLAPDELDDLVSAAERRSYRADELVVDEGTASDCLFVLLKGSVRVERELDGRRVTLATLVDGGDFFGEMSLIDILPRSADIRATGQVEVLAFPKRDLTDFFSRSPRVQMTMILNIARSLSLRLREADARIVELSGTR